MSQHQAVQTEPPVADDPDTLPSEAESPDAAAEKLLRALLEAQVMPSSPDRLRFISTYTRRPGGLANDQLRQLAWPILLGSSGPDPTKQTPEAHAVASPDLEHSSNNWRHLAEHDDEGQVRLDVNRSFIYYPNDKSDTQLAALKADLLDVITATLRRHPKLCYFQGFHDIVQVLLLVLGKERAFDAVARLSLLRLRDFMLPSLASSITHLELLPAILTAADPLLAAHVSQTRPFFALAATLTMFSHNVESYSEIARLFDFLLAEEAAVSVYLFASIILSRRDELLAIPAEDQDILSFTLSKLPQPLDFEAIIRDCVRLVDAHPPDRLPHHAWAKVSPYSVLKTTRGGRFHDLADAEEFFDRQLAQLARQERRTIVLSALWTYRKPIGGAGAAVLVAVLSYWLRQPSGTSALLYATNKLMLVREMFMRFA